VLELDAGAEQQLSNVLESALPMELDGSNIVIVPREPPSSSSVFVFLCCSRSINNSSAALTSSLLPYHYPGERSK
jgi:hypothetical protein